MSARESTITLGRARRIVEGSLDPRELVSSEMRKMGVPHRFEDGGKHLHLVYHTNGREHRFPVSKGKKGDGAIRQVIVSALRRHVRFAQGQVG